MISDQYYQTLRWVEAGLVTFDDLEQLKSVAYEKEQKDTARTEND